MAASATLEPLESSRSKPSCSDAPCPIHSLFQPPSPADVTSDLQDHNQQQQLLKQMQQQPAAARPSPTGSDAERTQQGTPTYSSCSEEEQGEDGHDVSDPQPAATSIRRGGTQLQKQPQPQPAPSPGARDGDAVSSGKRVPTISTGDAGSVARSADDGEAGRRGPGRGAGATSSVAVAAADEDDASASSATTSTRSEASPAVSARAAGVYRTTHEMLFGQPHGFFAGYPVHRRERGSWRPLR